MAITMRVGPAGGGMDSAVMPRATAPAQATAINARCRARFSVRGVLDAEQCAHPCGGRASAGDAAAATGDPFMKRTMPCMWLGAVLSRYGVLGPTGA